MRLTLLLLLTAALTTPQERPTVVLDNGAVEATIDLAGGGLVSFHLTGSDLNPFMWEEGGAPAAPRPRGHFLCLDRWGAPSEAERANGMPYHGEASRVMWKVARHDKASVEMSADLPMAGLHIVRRSRLDANGAVLRVTESVTNQRPLGRIYNMVQHPTIGPPFLDESTLVDANARRGFMQSSPLPNPEEPSVYWPQALKDALPVDLRHLTDDPMPNVVSYVIDQDHGWTTAVNPARRLLVGYVWKTADYPWFSAWRHAERGKPVARGLEFGTTGLHQPYPILVKKGFIFGRPLFSHLDAGETATRGYVLFLAQLPENYRGVASLEVSKEGLELTERGPGSPRTLRIAAPDPLND